MPTIAELAERYSARLAGESNRVVQSLAPLSLANPDQLAFLANPLYRDEANKSAAGTLIVSESDYEYLTKQSLANPQRSYLVTKNPYALFARIAQEFAQSESTQYLPGIHSSSVIEDGAVIDPSAHIGPMCHISKNAKIGAGVVLISQVFVGPDVFIGNQTILNPQVSIYKNCRIGSRCIIHSGAVVGSDGFGFAPDFSATGGEWVKVPQTGAVEIGDDVEIGSNSSIDRGAMANTVIENGCKIDNLVQIAHNVKIGAFSVIAGCTAIAGSTTIGKMCIIGGSANFAGHLKIADRTTISGGTNVMKSIDHTGQHFTSVYPMLPHSDWEKNAAIVRSLDKMRQRIRELENQMKSLFGVKK
jgi:UDP-3-O-[3-hydroxymyristoyl] glucosamine N-acyltransferase